MHEIGDHLASSNLHRLGSDRRVRNLQNKRWNHYADYFSSDCLRMNIWKPTSAREGDNLPVVVYIHVSFIIHYGYEYAEIVCREGASSKG